MQLDLLKSLGQGNLADIQPGQTVKLSRQYSNEVHSRAVQDMKDYLEQINAWRDKSKRSRILVTCSSEGVCEQDKKEG